MKAVATLLAFFALAGCDLSMTRQLRHETFSSAWLWPDGAPRLGPPDGTVAQGDPARQDALLRPPPMSMALLERGRERFDIYCAPCHGPSGDGDGVIVRHGFPAPPSYHGDRLRAAPAAYMVDVITHGYGLMYPYAERVDPADRWAIAAWIKVLQRARADQQAEATR